MAFTACAGVALSCLAVALGTVFQVPPPWAILSLSVLTVLLIVFGDELEKWLLGAESRPNVGWLRSIANALLSREALLPCFLIAGLWLAGYVRTENIGNAIFGKFDILLLILSFAVLAQGIKHSGYFKYSAYRVLEVCDGRMFRMTLYLFALCSILTFVTSNDIVILVMTPIVIELCRQARIPNARLLLISQFVAANTLSMGLLIGSPTNIIIASEIGLSFFDYLALMFIPSVLAVTTGFLAVSLINAGAQRFVGAWQCPNHYSMPALKEQLDFTNEMRGWIYGFIAVLVGVAVISHYGLPFFWVTLPAMLIALAVIAKKGKPKTSGETPLQQCLGGLPYQIFFFAFAFFAISDALVESLPLERILAFTTERGLWWNSMSSMIGTGMLVNTINDLPAAAVTGKILAQASVLGSVDSDVLTESVLVALNIGCYVTPVGALAGIIWFHIMRSDGGDLKTPTKPGMVVYGLLHFTAVTAVLSILIPFTNLGIRWLSSAHSVLDPQAETTLWLGAGTLLIVLLFAYTNLRNHQVRLLDMRAFLTAASWINVRARHTGAAFQALTAMLVITAFMGVIWLAEGDPRNGQGGMDSLGDFIVWNITFLASGFEGEWFPEKPIARIVAGLMPILAIFFIVRALQAVGDQSSLRNISRRIATGEIITRRSVVLDYRHWMRPMIRSIWKSQENRIFQTILYVDHQPPQQWSTEADHDDIYTVQSNFEIYANIGFIVEDYRLWQADEILLLGDVFHGEEGKAKVREVILDVKIWLLGAGIAFGEKDATDGDFAGEAEKRFRSIMDGEDPEDNAGRLPRLFVWDDAVPDDPNIGDEMERLLICLPAAWRQKEYDEMGRLLKRTIADTAEEKSWKARRREIEKIVEE